MDLPRSERPDESETINPKAFTVPEIWRARAARPVSFPLQTRSGRRSTRQAGPPTEKILTFSYWQQGGFRDIVTLHLHSGELRYITHDRALDLEPRFSPMESGFTLFPIEPEFTTYTRIIWKAESPTRSPML